MPKVLLAQYTAIEANLALVTFLLALTSMIFLCIKTLTSVIGEARVILYLLRVIA
jgi:hypothetical protein